MSGGGVSVVCARHLLLKREPRLNGNDDLMDARQKRRGHFVGHCESGRKKHGLWQFTGFKFPQIGVLGSARGHSRQWDGYSVTLVGYARLIWVVPGQ